MLQEKLPIRLTQHSAINGLLKKHTAICLQRRGHKNTPPRREDPP